MLKEMNDKVPSNMDLVTNDYPPIEQPPVKEEEPAMEEGEIQEPCKEEEEVKELTMESKEEGEVEETPNEAPMDPKPPVKEENDLKESCNKQEDEAGEVKDVGTEDKDEMEVETAKKIVTAELLKELVAQWKKAVESKSVDALEKVYPIIEEYVDDFSLDFMM